MLGSHFLILDDDNDGKNFCDVYRMATNWKITKDDISHKNPLFQDGVELGEYLIEKKIIKFTVFDIASGENVESIDEALINLPSWYYCYKSIDNKRMYKLNDEKFYQYY